MELVAALFVIFLLYLAATALNLSVTAVVVGLLTIAALLALADPGRLLWRR